MANDGTERTANVKLTLSNAQLILNVLSERPYQEVAPLISDLMDQIKAQLRQKSTPSTVASVKQHTERFGGESEDISSHQSDSEAVSMKTQVHQAKEA